MTRPLFLAMLLVTFLGVTPASAHFMWLTADDPVNLWLGRQHDARNGYCCDGTDAFVYDGAYTVNPDGTVSLPLPDGTVQVIEAYKVLPFRPLAPDPNPTGSAVWWHSIGYATYCFALGPLV